MYITSCSDDKLKKRMLECDEPTPQLLEEIVQCYARVQADTSGTRESARAAAISSDKDKQCREMNDSRGKPSGHKLAALDGKCYRCGSSTHRAKECKIDKTIPCKNCNIRGHLAIVCQSPVRANIAQRNQPSFPRPDAHSWPAQQISNPNKSWHLAPLAEESTRQDEGYAEYETAQANMLQGSTPQS